MAIFGIEVASIFFSTSGLKMARFPEVVVVICYNIKKN
jgi:hypothetical protein